MKNKIFLLLMLFSVVTGVAQNVAPAGDLIQGSLNDANKLIDAYTTPMHKGVIFSMGQMNYTGFGLKGEKKFSVSLKTIFLFSPQTDRTYDVTKLQLETLEPADPNNTKAQTIFGDSTSTITLQSKDKDLLGRPLYSFKTPTGSGYPGFPIPYIDVNYKWRSFSFSAGFIPLVPVPTTDLNIFMIRGGVAYNLAPLTGFLDEKKFEWSVSATGGYFHGFADLHITPEGLSVSLNVTPSGQHNGPYDNQQFLLDYIAAGGATHLAYRFKKHWRVYGGTGYTWGMSHLQIVGRYPVYTSDPTGTVSLIAEDIDDPVDLTGQFGQFYGEAGIRGDWKHFYFQLQGSAGSYSGIGFGVGYKVF